MFGLIVAALMIAFLASLVIKVKEPALMAAVRVGLVMMVIDLWHARNESDT